MSALIYLGTGIFCLTAVLILLTLFKAGTAVHIAGALLTLPFFIAALRKLLFIDYDLRKMWLKINIASEDEINALFENSVPLAENELCFFISDEYILNFDTYNAYRLRDIRKLKRSDQAGGKNAAYNIEIRLSKPSRTKKDIMRFGDQVMRDMVYGRLADAVSNQ